MLGVCLNLILVVLASLSLGTGISFKIQEKETGYISSYTLLFGTASFFICGGYAFMGFMANLKYAFIPRLIGLYGVDVFLLMELAFLLLELHTKTIIRSPVIGFFALVVLLDLIIFGRPSSLNYVRYELYTAYENKGGYGFYLHYVYIIIIAFSLLCVGIQWYKSKKLRRDKLFSIEVMSANFVILFAAIPDMFHAVFTTKYPTFAYSASFAFVYFSWWFACKSHITYNPTIKNVSQEVFHSIDVPILIFDIEGKVNLQNPCATKELNIENGTPTTIREIFELSDVDTLRLLKKSKDGIEIKMQTKIRATGKNCILSTALSFDKSGEPFCIIGTVLQNQDIE